MATASTRKGSLDSSPTLALVPPSIPLYRRRATPRSRSSAGWDGRQFESPRRPTAENEHKHEKGEQHRPEARLYRGRHAPEPDRLEVAEAECGERERGVVNRVPELGKPRDLPVGDRVALIGNDPPPT
jgi:hypothetical protein